MFVSRMRRCWCRDTYVLEISSYVCHAVSVSHMKLTTQHVIPSLLPRSIM